MMSLDARPTPARQRHFSQRHRQSAVGNVMNGRDQAKPNPLPDIEARVTFQGKVDCRRFAIAAALDFRKPQRLSEVPLRPADDENMVAVLLERGGRAPLPILKQPDPANRRRRQDSTPAPGRLALVVEAYVAAHDREVEGAAGFAHAFEAADELG